MPIRWKLGEVLIAKGVTALELARLMGVHHPGVYRLSTRTTLTRITGKKLYAICAALGCQPGDLMDAPDIPRRPPPKPKASKRR